MGVEVRVEHYGRQIVRGLGEEIAKAQDADPLAPVTVLVPRATTGLATRRWLASGQLGSGAPGRRPGIVNVRFLPLGRFAASLGETAMVAAGRVPGNPAVELSAARAVLATGLAPLLGDVSDHPATARVLVDAYRDLRPVSLATRRALARQGPRPAQVVALVEAMGVLLRRWFDDVDLAEAAASAVEADAAGALGPFGHVIAYLLGVPTPQHRRLLEAVARRWSLTVLVGTTGVAVADESARRLADIFGGSAGLDGVGSVGLDGGGAPTTGAATAAAVGTGVLSAPSADTEVLAVVRKLMDRMAGGVPLDRMAIAHGGAPRLARLIREALDQAGVEHNGSSARPLSATLAGRVLPGLFDVLDGGWRRPEVMAWLSTGPLRFEGRVIPVSDWDRVSRRAGVVSGVGEWSERLEAYARRRPAPADAGPAPADAGPAPADAGPAMALSRFVDATAARCSLRPGTWAGWVDWARALLRDLLGDPDDHATWPPDEAEAFTGVGEILGQLAVLDELEGGPDLTTFRSALAAGLEHPAPQTTRFGRGVLVASVAEMVGVDLDVIFVVGMEDGTFPCRRGEDPLLADRDRAAAGPDVPLRAGQPADAHRDFLAALASADERQLSYSRGDQHSRLERRPARWVLDTLASLAGRSDRLYAGDVEGLDRVPGFEVVPSFTAAVRSGGEPADLADRDRRSLDAWRERTGRLDGHPLVVSDPVLATGLDTQRHRRSGGFSRFEGRVDHPHLDVPSPVGGAARSPTGLETYAVCPRRYLLERVLGLDVTGEPESLMRITPQDRGRLIHAILERWVREGLESAGPEAGDVLEPGSPRWVVEGTQRITAIAGEVFDEYERAGLTGRELFWEIDRGSILVALRRFVTDDGRYRRRTGAVPVAVELRFGTGEVDPVEVPVPGRGVVRFRGVIDRIDRIGPPGHPGDSDHPDDSDDSDPRGRRGSDVVVIDYKSGRPVPADRDGDPVGRGRRLQLPIYALAARGHLGDVSVGAAYWWLTSPNRFEPAGLELDGAVLDRLGTVVGTLVQGIESGAFPARPGVSTPTGFDNCRYCPFDSVCPARRDRIWEQVRTDPLVAPYAELAEGAGAGS
ncbi:MAG: PD-(D/E)XK nuclease family protein [Acidimicrobiales bacterium]